ncbi:MAG: sulfate ABC transporter substrate-binding protein [Gammaproteobacteria bacterium]|nr:sulfate ABC transporter substrate-binding protein [Gammaproteobacteria bacterium]
MKINKSIFKKVAIATSFGLALTNSVWAADSLLNVSYDVSRELYKSINPAFETFIQKQQNRKVTINQSHGGSSKQAMAVAAGLEADVITMNQSPDIQMLADKGLIAANWQEQFPHNATPYSTTTVFLVRKGNPENIQDWSDLTRSGLEVIVPNPKTSGNGRYTYLAAWGYALETTGSEQGAKDFVTKLFANVPVLDGGGRGATTTFTQRDVGDVLVTFENEAILIAGELGKDKFDVVYPSLSIDASAPVAIIKSVTEKRGTTELAREYLNFLYSEQGQEIIAKQNFRPRNQTVLANFQHQYPTIKTFTVEEKLGGWAAVKAQHFADGALFDQIMVNR